jgi:hypothetical protein
MYNWSTDEKKFKKRHSSPIRKIVSFLETNSHIETMRLLRNKNKKGHLIIQPKYTLKVKLCPSVKPAEMTTLAFTLQEIVGDFGISVVEKK